jgi:FtsH-binding integral membrane protein
MAEDRIITQGTLTSEQVEENQRTFMLKVFGWMATGLLLTGVAGMAAISSRAILDLVFTNKLVFYGLLFAQLGLVVWLSARIEKMSAMTATLVFVGYSALTGLTLSVIFLAYTVASLASTFFVTAGTFGAMYLYGTVTKRDLTSMGSFMGMGLIGVIIASVVNMFMQNTMIYWITTYIGIIIFVGLTAYDAQKIKQMSVLATQGEEIEQKGAIMGALRLYLDFINLFLLLLRVMGKRR